MVFLSITGIAQTPHDSTTIQLEEVEIQSYGFTLSDRLLPAAVTVLNQTKLATAADPSFVRAVNTVAGVKMDERSPGSYRLSIRGNLLRSPFGVRNVKVYWNGIPFTDASGTTYLNQVGFDNVGEMEILKGPAGSMYGAGTGGVLLMSSPEPDTGKNLSVHSSISSYKTRFTGGRFTWNDGNNSGLVSYSKHTSDGYRKQSALRRDVTNYLGHFTLNPKHELNANIFYSDLEYETPGGLNAAELAADPQQARPGAEANQAALRLKTIYAGLGSKAHFSKGTVQETGIYIAHTRFENPTTRNYEKKTEQGMGGRTSIAMHKNAWDFIAGGEYQFGFNNTGVYGNMQGVRDTLQYQDELTSRLWNVFAQAGYHPGKWRLSLGVSYNNYHYGFLRTSDVGSPGDESDFKPIFVPRFAAIYQAGRHTNLYASVSEGYSPPSIDEIHASDGLFNTELRPEKGTNYEAGVKMLTLNRKMKIDLSVYQFNLRQTIVSRRDSSGGEYFVNAGKTRQFGIEAALQWYPIRRLPRNMQAFTVWGNYTYLHARFSHYQQDTEKFDGNRLTGVPEHVVNLGINTYLFNALNLQAQYNYTGSIPLNDANTVIAKHYNQIFAKAAYRFNLSKTSHPELFFAWERTFNNPYGLGNDLNPAVNRFYNPSPPHRILFGIKLDLGWQ